MAIQKSVFDQPQAATVTHDEPPPGLERWTGDRSFFGHPGGLLTCFLTEMWERFSFYGIRPLLVFFMTAALASGGFGFERTEATSIVGIYAACAYLSSLPGGWIADRWLGLQRSIWWGGVLIALGHLAIALSILFARAAFFSGLVLIVLGTGLLKPNVSAIVGGLYPEGGARRDAAFSIFYMGINTGALIAPLISGWLGEKIGWHIGFGSAGVGMLIGLVMYRARASRTLGPIGAAPTGAPAEQRRVRNMTFAGLAVIVVFVLLAALGVIPIDPVWVAQRMSVFMLTLAAIYFAYLLFFAGLNGRERKQVGVIIVLFAFSIVFWAAFEQAPTSLNLFARDFTERTIGGFLVPASWFQSVESVFVIGFAPAFAALWVMLARRGWDLSSPAKFAIGLAFAAVAFYLMLIASRRVIAGTTGPTPFRVSMWWLIGSYALQAFGELALSPVGLSSMTKLAPKRFVGQMMGVWFLSLALGDLIAGLVGGHVNPEKLNEMPLLFQRTTISLLIAAVVLALLAVPIRRMMERGGEAHASY
jgi:POT family proton-dependent oligopeptide transporter